jgi:hypothetical protein
MYLSCIGRSRLAGMSITSENPKLKGGGPHYIIDAHTGTVISKRYEQ